MTLLFAVITGLSAYGKIDPKIIALPINVR